MITIESWLFVLLCILASPIVLLLCVCAFWIIALLIVGIVDLVKGDKIYE